jgi:hypothetical protein
VRVLADECAEFREPPLEFVVEALLMGEPRVEALKPALQSQDDFELGVNREPEGAEFGRLRSRDVVVELLDEADDHLGAFPIKLVELLTGEHKKTASGEEKGGAG